MLLLGCALVRLRGGWMGSIMSPEAGVWALKPCLWNTKCSTLFYLPGSCVRVSRWRKQMRKLGYKFFWDWSALTKFDGMLFLLVWKGMPGLYTAVPHMSEEQRYERPVTAPIFPKESPIIQHKPTELLQVHVTDVFCLRGKHWSCAHCKLGTYLSKTTLWGGHM